MKNIQRVILALVVCGGFIMSSCNSQSTQRYETEMTEAQGKDFTSKYVCPMHCEGSGSEEPGTCPVCEMDYVLNENYEGSNEEAHDHEMHNANDEHETQESHEEHENHDGHEHKKLFTIKNPTNCLEIQKLVLGLYQ